MVGCWLSRRWQRSCWSLFARESFGDASSAITRRFRFRSRFPCRIAEDLRTSHADCKSFDYVCLKEKYNKRSIRFRFRFRFHFRFHFRFRFSFARWFVGNVALWKVWYDCSRSLAYSVFPDFSSMSLSAFSRFRFAVPYPLPFPFTFSSSSSCFPSCGPWDNTIL